MEAKFRPYVIPEDILQKTLVVFGNEDPEFVMAQLPVRELAKTLGFQIKTCLNKSSFFEAIKETGPELLIIDTHGGVDETTHNSFIMMGDDIITGDDVVNSGIGPQLVFLSACNTFTTYNTINTIANAFSQIGANAVTTSYMPLHVLPATVLYIRLLRNLNKAAHKNIPFKLAVIHITSDENILYTCSHREKRKSKFKERNTGYTQRTECAIYVFRQKKGGL